MIIEKKVYNRTIKILKQSIEYATEDKWKKTYSIYHDDGKIATTTGKILFVHPVEIQFENKISFDIDDVKKLERITDGDIRVFQQNDFMYFDEQKVKIYKDKCFRFQMIESRKTLASIDIIWKRIEQYNKEVLVLFDSEDRKIELPTKVFKKFFNKNFTFENCENYAIKGTFRDTCIFMSHMR